LVFTGLSLPAAVSYIDMLPYYSRGSGTSYQDTLSNSFELQHLVTFFFPGALNTVDMQSVTDISCRSVFIGIFPFIILTAFPPVLNKRNIMLIALAVFALLFSLGDSTPVRKLCYDFLPLMDSFRHPSQLRLFFIIALLLLTAPGLKKFLNNNPSLNGIKAVNGVAGVAFLLITLLAAIDSHFVKRVLDFNLSGTRDALKNIISGMSLADVVFISGCTQIIFIGFFVWQLKKGIKIEKWFSALLIANLFIMAQLAFPVSFVSKTSPKEINAIINASPEGFPVAPLSNTLYNNSTDAFENYEKVSLSFFYNKKIGISRVAYTPSFLDEHGNFLNTRLLYDYVASQPVVYLADSILSIKDTAVLKSGSVYKYAFIDSVSGKGGFNIENKAVLKKISANCFEVESKSSTLSMLVLTQSWYHHWKVWVDGRPEKIHKTNMAFMGVYLQPGQHKIVFRFAPDNTIKALWLMLATAATLVMACIVSFFRRANHLQA